MSSLAALVVVASTIVGQAETPSQSYEHLKQFEPLIGEWEFKGEAWEDGPLAGKGAGFGGRSCYNWTWDKSAIRHEGWLQYDNGFKVFVSGMISWNPGLEQIVAVAMDSGGGHSQAVFSYCAEEKTWKRKGCGVNPKGEKVSNTNLIVLKDATTFTWQATEQVRAGKKLDDTPKVLLTRVKPE